MAERLEFRCPHCRRAYSLELDAAKLARLDRIAVCGRCRKPFSLAKRVREATDDPPTAEPEVSERDLRDAIVKKRELEKAQREERARQALARARDSSGSPIREPLRKPLREPVRMPSPTTSPARLREPDALRETAPPRDPVRLREPAPQTRADTAPASSPGKRRWDSVPAMRAVRKPPAVPVRKRDAEGSTPHEPRRARPESERAAPSNDVFARARERADALVKPTTPLPSPVERLPAAKPLERPTSKPVETARVPDIEPSPPLEESPLRRRVTSPGLGALGGAESPSRITPVPISAPSPRRAPTPPPSRIDEAAPVRTTVEPVSEPPLLPDDELEDFDDLSYEDDDDDFDGGDRPTLLLPDEGMLGSLIADLEAPPNAAVGLPRKATARVIMSRRDWINAADPGLVSLTRKDEPEVAALVALLDLAPIGKHRVS